MLTLLMLLLIFCAIFVLAIIVGAVTAIGGIIAPIVLGAMAFILIDVIVIKTIFKKRKKK